MEITNEIIEQIINNVMESRCDNKNPSEDINIIRLCLEAIRKLQEKEREQPIKFAYIADKYGQAAKEFGVPQRVYPHDAGIDLPIVLSEEEQKHSKIIWPGERESLHTGLIGEWPMGYHGRITHRSSTEKRYRLRIIEGIIDDYRGELLVQVHNPNDCKIEVYHGQRLAQLIVLPTVLFRTEHAKTLRPSKRSDRGFGSSDKVSNKAQGKR